MISSASSLNELYPASSFPNQNQLFDAHVFQGVRNGANSNRLECRQQRSGVFWRRNAIRLRGSPLQSQVLLDSVRVLGWDEVCDSVAAFAGTTLGKDALLAQLTSLDLSYDDSLLLQKETTALVEMLKYGVGGLDFASLDLAKVKCAVDRASRGLVMDGDAVMSLVGLLQSADALQLSLRVVLKEDADRSYRFAPLSDMIFDMTVNRSVIKAAMQVLDEDGSVKDTASSELKRHRNQVRQLEQKIYSLMDTLLRNAKDEAYSQEVSNVDGRWCIRMSADGAANFPGLLLRGDSSAENFVEPISAVGLNDELEQARALVVKAERDVLSKLTQKLFAEPADFDDLQKLLDVIVQLDMICARAKYGLAFGGTCAELFIPVPVHRSSINNDLKAPADGGGNVSVAHNVGREWNLYLRKAYHPILLQKYKENLQKAREDLKKATAEARRKRLQGDICKGEVDGAIKSLELKLADLEGSHPVSVDFFVSGDTKVLVITGPNTGGKTISLKTVGLAALMAKVGLYILASEPARVPWFDSIFADIGDEQSLLQSLSTFSGHLSQISRILSNSTQHSLVLLDEVGAGTNPIEGAALGMSILEALAEDRCLLTMATTHHGELKSLKYSNCRFENACVEFDEVELKPTYKILWGVPGRSNAINIAEKLCLPPSLLNNARNIYGSASAEINKVIIDLEKFKQEFQHHVNNAQQKLRLTIDIHGMLLEANQKVKEHRVIQRFKKTQEISEAAGRARSILHSKLRQLQTSKVQALRSTTAALKTQPDGSRAPGLPERRNEFVVKKAPGSDDNQKPSLTEKQTQFPEIGEMVVVPSLARKMKVLKVDASKEEVVLQAANMKLILRLSDVISYCIGMSILATVAGFFIRTSKVIFALAPQNTIKADDNDDCTNQTADIRGVCLYQRCISNV